jgi:hypothetical protein
MSIRDMNHDPLTEYPHLLHTLAFHAAVKIVKQQIQARGERLPAYLLGRHLWNPLAAAIPRTGTE